MKRYVRNFEISLIGQDNLRTLKLNPRKLSYIKCLSIIANFFNINIWLLKEIKTLSFRFLGDYISIVSYNKLHFHHKIYFNGNLYFYMYKRKNIKSILN